MAAQSRTCGARSRTRISRYRSNSQRWARRPRCLHARRFPSGQRTLMRKVSLIIVLLVAGTIVSAADRFPATGGDILITPFLHSSVQIEHAGTVVQVDPWSAADL